jgi:hypothetical protein
VARHEHGGIKSFQVCYRALDLGLVTHCQMEAAYHGVKRCWFSGSFQCMSGCIDHTGMAAAREYDKSFP